MELKILHSSAQLLMKGTFYSTVQLQLQLQYHYIHSQLVRGTVEENRQVANNPDEQEASNANLNAHSSQSELRKRLSSISSPRVGEIVRRFLSRSNSNQSTTTDNLSNTGNGSKSNLLNVNMKSKKVRYFLFI